MTYGDTRLPSSSKASWIHVSNSSYILAIVLSSFCSPYCLLMTLLYKPTFKASILIKGKIFKKKYFVWVLCFL